LCFLFEREDKLATENNIFKINKEAYFLEKDKPTILRTIFKTIKLLFCMIQAPRLDGFSYSQQCIERG